MEVYSIAAVLAALFNISIGVWIFAEHPRSKVTKRFLIAAVLLSFWGIAEGLAKLSPDEQTSLMWIKISYIPFFVLPAVVSYLTYRISTGRQKAIFYASVMLYIPFIVLLFTDSFIQGVSNTGVGYEPVYGSIFPYFALTHMFMVTVGFSLLYSESMGLKALAEMPRIDIMIYGFLMSIIFIYTFELISPLLGLGLPKIGSVFSIFATAGSRYAHLYASTAFSPKTKDLVNARDAPCGALCSLCSSFLTGRCVSCSMGPETRDQCAIFQCTKENNAHCHECGRVMTCEVFRKFKEKCPFSDPLKTLPPGGSYRIESEEYATARSVFRDRLIRGDFGLVVTREHPIIFFKQWDLEEIPIIWLSIKEEGKWSISPENLAKLSHVVSNFISEAPVSSVLFEGFEYLVIHNSFKSAMKVIYNIDDEVVRNQCRFILSFDPRTFDNDYLAILERELKALPEGYLIE
jgi:hypothetical protein